MTIFTRLLKGAAIAALLACPSSALANIGDDLTQLRAHYGSAKDMENQMLFEVQMVEGRIIPAHTSAATIDHFSVTVYFDGERSAMEVFTRNTSDPVKSNLSQKDIDAFLALAADGQSWTSVQTPSGRATWVRSDGKLVARFSPNAEGSADGASVFVIMVNRK